MTTGTAAFALKPPALGPRPAESLRWLLALWIVTTGIFTTLYFQHPVLPSGPATGWWGWWDQSQYRLMAEAIAEGRLDRTSYQYPMGYSLLGVPFVRWMPNHLFFLPTLLSVCLSVHCLYAIARPVVTRPEAALLALAAIFAHPLIGSETIVPPFNNTPVLAASLAVTWLFVARSPGRPALWICALLVPLLFHVRTLEWLVLSLLAVAALALRREWKALLQYSLAYVIVFVIAFAIVAWINLRIAGMVLPPYTQRVNDIGFFSYPVAWKTYWTIFATDDVVGGAQSLAEHFPWILLALPGAVVFARTVGAASYALFGALALLSALYINFNDLFPSMLFRYHNQRYFVWPVVLALIFAYVTFSRAWRVLPRAWWVLLLVTPSLAYLVRLDFVGEFQRLSPADSASADRLTFTIPAPYERPMDFVRFHGITADGSHVELEADGRRLIPYRDFFLMNFTDPRHLALAHPVAHDLTLRIPVSMVSGDRLDLSKGRLRWRFRWSGAVDVARRYEPGSTIDFADSESTLGYLQRGFSGQDHGFRWTDGKRARIALRGPASLHPGRLSFAAQSFRRQRVRITVNGVTVGDTVFTGTDVEERTFALFQDLPVDEGLYDIEFHLPDAARPSETIGTGDARRLGLAFRWLRVESDGPDNGR